MIELCINQLIIIIIIILNRIYQSKYLNCVLPLYADVRVLRAKLNVTGVWYYAKNTLLLTKASQTLIIHANTILPDFSVQHIAAVNLFQIEGCSLDKAATEGPQPLVPRIETALEKQ